jgi:hypothetical protein
MIDLEDAAALLGECRARGADKNSEHAAHQYCWPH